jgi:hypothetical protein
MCPLRTVVLRLRRVRAGQQCRTVTRQTRRGHVYAAVRSIATRGLRKSRRRRGGRMPSPLEQLQGVGDTPPFRARPGAGTSATCQPGERAAGQILHLHPAHAPRPGRKRDRPGSGRLPRTRSARRDAVRVSCACATPSSLLVLGGREYQRQPLSPRHHLRDAGARAQDRDPQIGCARAPWLPRATR